MTTTRLGRLDDTGASEPVDPDQPIDEDLLGELLDASPDLRVHTSAAAVTGFGLALVAVVAAPFALLEGLSVVLAGLGLLVSVVGLARASRPVVAGTALASTGMLLALAALALWGLRYLGVDTAVGDALLPSLRDGLEQLDRLVP